MPRFPLVSTLVVLAAVATMVALGFWQLGRLEEKEALIARYEAAAANSEISALRPDQPEAAFTRVMENCAQPRDIRAVAGRNAQGASGWAHVVRCTIGGPFPDTKPEDLLPDYDLSSADIVLGWSQSPDNPQWNGGLVTGTVVPAGELGFKIVADPPLAGLAANAKPDPNDLPNNHLAYAVQWFLFALTALVIYVLALKRKQRAD